MEKTPGKPGEKPEAKGPRKRQPPRKMTRERVFNIARFHVERFSTTTGHLRMVLMRRADRALRVHGGDRTEVAGWVEEAVQSLVRAGAVDDARFALAKAQALRHRGRTAARIRAALLSKGVPRELIDQAVTESSGPSDDDDAYASARAYIQRRRLGPFRPKDRVKTDRQELRQQQQKDLAALVRAGFPFDIARRVLAEEN